ncbi:MAG: twin-arginine translocase subunit TatC [Kangiellaceae bacterium]|nr:twin-arginine translocase subunit TatC [Kangiellaceae bacterium]|tara:strand:- start:11072 stop:11833 length:762 start_codon:yes stop_codon:yes gene_type:complete
MSNATTTEDMPLVSHLLELRDRLLRALLSVLIVFIPLVFFRNELYTLFSNPIIEAMPEGSKMLATDVASTFFTPIKLTIVASFFIAIPAVLYQIWAFIAPGLYEHEKKWVFPLMVFSSSLFYLGIAFAYFVVLPIAFMFFSESTPEGVTLAPDITSYLNLVLKLFFAFGLAFEVPIATFLVVLSGMTTVESLREKRPYIVVGAFIVGMLLTPPDAISQTLLAVPMWLLYEVGIIMASKIKKSPEDISDNEEDA